MSIKILAAAAAALSLAACSGTMADGGMGQRAMVARPMAGDMTPTAAMPYLMMAGASDLYEIESSRLHHQKGVDARLHSYASMMIDHHMRTTSATMAAARAAGMAPPPPMLTPMQAEMIARLQDLSGAAFDREYQRQQVMAHEMALALHDNYARRGDTPSLRATAGAAVPVVRGHLAQVRTLRI